MLSTFRLVFLTPFGPGTSVPQVFATQCYVATLRNWSDSDGWLLNGWSLSAWLSVSSIKALVKVRVVWVEVVCHGAIVVDLYREGFGHRPENWNRIGDSSIYGWSARKIPVDIGGVYLFDSSAIHIQHSWALRRSTRFGGWSSSQLGPRFSLASFSVEVLFLPLLVFFFSLGFWSLFFSFSATVDCPSAGSLKLAASGWFLFLPFALLEFSGLESAPWAKLLFFLRCQCLFCVSCAGVPFLLSGAWLADHHAFNEAIQYVIHKRSTISWRV